ncbi:unnamed protein product [Penicillium bialowiezense]
MTDMEKTTEDHVEAIDGGFSKQQVPAAEVEVMGTVKLTEDTIVYIPTPTADPRGMSIHDEHLFDDLANQKIDPLNMSIWQKIIILVVVSTYSALGNSLVSGFGGLITFYLPEYSAAGKDYAAISALLTYPTLFM